MLRWSARAGSAAMPVRLEKVHRGDLVEVVTAPGKIEPKTKVPISARVAARIIELRYEEGDVVTKGSGDGKAPPSVLVKLESKDLDAALRSAKARRNAQAAQIEVDNSQIASLRSGLVASEVELEKTRLDLKRKKELLATGDVSQSEVDDLQAQADAKVARIESDKQSLESKQKNLKVLAHNIESADADIAKAEDNLSYTTIYSPIDGVVSKLNSEVGELAIVGTTNTPGTVIMEVADFSKMLLIAQVDEADIGGVKVGQKAHVRIEAYPDRVFDGAVTQIALTATEQPSKHFEVEILLDTGGDRIYSGLTADVDIDISHHQNVLKVPSQAVVGRLLDDLPQSLRQSPLVDAEKTIAAVVFKHDAQGQAVAVPVKIGASDATHTVIEAGLGEGDTIIVGPYKGLEGLQHDQKVVDESQVTEDQRRDYFKRQQMMQSTSSGRREGSSGGGGSRR